ncbi:MAG: glycosyltransferase family 4 protein [Acidobacteriia bacterium]|nr:glycosyltransferase family 4 protein [Terriglobia bacterium]
MRTIFVTQWFDPEPGASRGLPLAKWLSAHGHDIRVLTAFPNYPGGRLYPGYRMCWRQWETMNGVPVLRVPLYPSHEYSIGARLMNYGSFALSASTIGAALIGPGDVGFVYHPPPTVGLAAVALKAFRGIPFVYHISDMWPESVVESGALGDGLFGKATERGISGWCDFVYRRASAITVLSPGFRKLLIDRGVPAEKVHVIYNWVDESIFTPTVRDEKLARALGFAGRFNVMYAGNLGTYQGLDTIIDAAVLLQDVPEVQIVIAGTGPDEKRIRLFAADKGVKNILFLERRSQREMGAVNNLADVLLVHLLDRPIFHSTIPGKAAVAMASGRPILMAVRGDAADTVLRSDCGLVIPPEDPHEMAAAIRRMHAMNPRAREAMGDRGRKFYLEHMALDLGAARMDSLLRQVARS